MTAEDIRVFVEPAIARFNDRDDRLGFLESYAPDVRLHGYPAGMDGHEGLKRFHASLWDAFPDAELGVEDTVVEGDRAALRYRLTGTHRGRYLGVAPTGRAIDVAGMMIVRVEGGRIVEEWHSPTELAILRALGVIEMSIAAPAAERDRREPPRASASAEAAALRLEEREDR
jgi:predicted ester cyclase